MTVAFAAPATNPNNSQSTVAKSNVAVQPAGPQLAAPPQVQPTNQRQPTAQQAPAQSPPSAPLLTAPASKTPPASAVTTSPPTATSTSNPNPPRTTVATPAPQKAATPTPFVNDHYVLTGSLKVNGYHPGDPTMIIVDKGSHSTYVLQLQNNQVTRVLTVSNAIGKEEKPTPPGRYYVLSKKQFPTWIPPKSIDKKQKPVPPYNETHKNPLGVAAIFLNKDELALHGTNDPSEIRQSASHGCVRHSNSDISKVYGMVHKGDTVLIIREFRGTVLNKSDFKSRQITADKKSSKTHPKS
jgi:lipoprotein-anchoring transpeptidase ErfK/SrfK